MNETTIQDAVISAIAAATQHTNASISQVYEQARSYDVTAFIALVADVTGWTLGETVDLIKLSAKALKEDES